MAETLHKYIVNKSCGQFFLSAPVESSVSGRLALYHWLRSSDLRLKEVEICAKPPNVAIKKLIGGSEGKKQSSSHTLQIVAQYLSTKFDTGKRDFMYKISFQPRDTNTDNSLQVERSIYSEVINPLILKRNTPFLVAFYGELKSACSPQQVYNSMPAADKDSFKRFFDDIRETGDYHTSKPMQMLITERAMGKQVSDVDFSKFSNPEATFFEMLFQILWTLLCFRDVGLSHNDLHNGNVFLNKDETGNIYLAYNKYTTFQFNRTLSTQIFDFDFSCKVPTKFNDCSIHNNKLEQKWNGSTTVCQQYGFCNNYDERRDITRFLTYMLIAHKNRKQIGNWLSPLGIVDVDFLRTRLLRAKKDTTGAAAWNGSICEVQKNALTCKTFPGIKKKVMPLSRMFLAVAKHLQKLGVVTRSGGMSFVCDNPNAYVLPSQAQALEMKNCHAK